MGLRLVWRDKVRDVIYSNVQRERKKASESSGGVIHVLSVSKVSIYACDGTRCEFSGDRLKR